MPCQMVDTDYWRWILTVLQMRLCGLSKSLSCQDRGPILALIAK